MASATDWRTLEERIAVAARTSRPAVAVAFLAAPPAGIAKFQGSQPSGCSFWRLAAAGRSFYTVPENHLNCALGAYTHNIRLSPDREKETEQTLQLMFDLGYVQPAEVAKIPRLPESPGAIAYAPLRDATFTPDAVLFTCRPAGAMLLNEAAARAGIGGSSALGRPTCMALPACGNAGAILSLGCIGNRVYTGLGEDELYFVVRGRDLLALAEELEVIAEANRALGEYARGRQAALASE